MNVGVWYNGDPTDRIRMFFDVFADTIGQRSRVPVSWLDAFAMTYELNVLITLDEHLSDLGGGSREVETIRRELETLEKPRREGYRIASGNSVVIVSGADERGLLYGLGKLLRALEIRRDSVTLRGPLRLSSTPRSDLRGHQLGYRPKTNAYDMWSKEQYRRYIYDLAIFGANAIELIPPRTDDEPKTPEMLYDQLEMMAWLSAEIHSLGLDVWIWYPNMSEDFSDPDTIRAESLEREQVYSTVPHVDAVVIPGGDPGHQEPSVLFEWGRVHAGILRKHHAEAGLWITAQISDATPSWRGAFFQELGNEPEWLTGVCHGPWVKGDVAAFRAEVPPRYPVRRYPDITHSLSCQYPVRDWDPVFAATLGRECYNPRPLDHKRIHNAYADHAIGSLSYSEGINDDVNKFIWSDQDWNPAIPVKETLRDYARLFVSQDFVEEIVEGLLGLERNWRGPIASNKHIQNTYNIWRGLEHKLPEATQSNYRLVMPLLRVYYDEYVRRRYFRERGIEERVVSIIERLEPETLEDGVTKIRSLLSEWQERPEFDYLRQHCIEWADRAFDLIRWQTSVVRHKGQAVVRGCFLDAIDFQISDLPFYESAVSRAAKVDGATEKRAVLKGALERSRPTTKGIFLDLCSLEDRPEIVTDCAWDEDPSGLSRPYIVNIPAPWPNYLEPGKLDGGTGAVLPMIERSYLSSFFCRPIEIRLRELDPERRYRLTVCYRTHRPTGGGLRLTAGGQEVHDYLLPPEQSTPMSFLLPEGSVTGEGVLRLVWQAYPFRVYSEGIAWMSLEVDDDRNPDEGPLCLTM